jgi:hypothetical protein
MFVSHRRRPKPQCPGFQPIAVITPPFPHWLERVRARGRGAINRNTPQTYDPEGESLRDSILLRPLANVPGLLILGLCCARLGPSRSDCGPTVRLDWTSSACAFASGRMDLVRSAGRAHFTHGGGLTHIAMERYHSGHCRDSLYVRRHLDAAASCPDYSLHYG